MIVAKTGRQNQRVAVGVQNQVLLERHRHNRRLLPLGQRIFEQTPDFLGAGGQVEILDAGIAVHHHLAVQDFQEAVHFRVIVEGETAVGSGNCGNFIIESRVIQRTADFFKIQTFRDPVSNKNYFKKYCKWLYQPFHTKILQSHAFKGQTFRGDKSGKLPTSAENSKVLNDLKMLRDG